MVHAALLAWLMMALSVREGAAGSSESVQLVFLAPQSLPKIRVDSRQPRRVEIRVRVSDPPPLLPGPATSWAAPSQSGSKDGGSGVDWTAEARRALQAFEIRSRQPARNNSVSRSSPAEQPWWPAHRPRERVKTADGNWIVWINANCYEVARSLPATDGSGPQPLTVCPKRSEESDVTAAGATP
jgi:hypothetical protein